MGLKQEKAESIINRHVLYSMGAGAIPIPLVDLGAVTAVQLDMIKQLCQNYGIDFNEVTGKSFIASLTGSLFARYGASLVKAVPGIGSLLGGILARFVSVYWKEILLWITLMWIRPNKCLIKSLKKEKK